jgi:hypothetical protein
MLTQLSDIVEGNRVVPSYLKAEIESRQREQRLRGGPSDPRMSEININEAAYMTEEEEEQETRAGS